MWEYKLHEAQDHHAFIENATALGSTGWELIDVERIHGHVLGYFKRPVPTGKK